MAIRRSGEGGCQTYILHQKLFGNQGSADKKNRAKALKDFLPTWMFGRLLAWQHGWRVIRGQGSGRNPPLGYPWVSSSSHQRSRDLSRLPRQRVRQKLPGWTESLEKIALALVAKNLLRVQKV
jgi:hypothetical protein